MERLGDQPMDTLLEVAFENNFRYSLGPGTYPSGWTSYINNSQQPINTVRLLAV